MKAITLTLLFSSGLSSFLGAQTQDVSADHHEFSPLAYHEIALEVLAESKEWINDFNRGHSEKCAERYADYAVMRATPFGLETGKPAISEFWKSFIASGAENLVYSNVKIEVVDLNTVFLSADWHMNVGRGVIYQEKWEKINGHWYYTYDDFEVLEQYDAPRVNTASATASHDTLEKVIRASMNWINGFNNHNSAICAEGYAKNAIVNAIPLAKALTKNSIAEFWSQLIADGAADLSYYNPTFEAVNLNTVKISADWTMNIGAGTIYQEKWINENDQWVLEYDEFQLLESF